MNAQCSKVFKERVNSLHTLGLCGVVYGMKDDSHRCISHVSLCGGDLIEMDMGTH